MSRCPECGGRLRSYTTYWEGRCRLNVRCETCRKVWRDRSLARLKRELARKRREASK